MTKPTNVLVEAPNGKGFLLTQQNIYVSSRPHVVTRSGEVELAEVRRCLAVLGTTTLTDEQFVKAYTTDPSKALDEALSKSEEVDEATVTASKLKAKEAAEAKVQRDAEEVARLQKEAEVRAADEKAHAELQAKAKTAGKAKAKTEG